MRESHKCASGGRIERSLLHRFAPNEDHKKIAPDGPESLYREHLRTSALPPATATVSTAMREVGSEGRGPAFAPLTGRRWSVRL